MRPLRFLLTILTLIITFSLVFIPPWHTHPENAHISSARTGPRLGSYIHWRTPSSLFSPSATISLTDDNSTFFLARPAGFGPLLPAKSLSGELWIGGGFGAAGQEGELGCSDVPWWDGGSSGQSVGADVAGTIRVGGEIEVNGLEESGRNNKRRWRSDEAADPAVWFDEDDGTDDHLHHRLPFSDSMKAHGGSVSDTTWKKPVHADIQSLQESAEIAGKIVLLSRGGCGFLEKVKWVQRRGGVAVIVGDNIRGAQLVTMYARGDTSNVTIPSLFASHNTAHLLSSLIPSGRLAESLDAENASRVGLTFGAGSEGSRQTAQKSVAVVEKPDFTTSQLASKPTKAPLTSENQRHEYQKYSAPDVYDDSGSDEQRVGWLRGMFSRKHGGSGDSRRHVGWIQEAFEDNWDRAYATTTMKSVVPAPTRTPQANAGDGFVIGVQDWRDPDLVAEQKEQLLASTPSSSVALPEISEPAVADRFDGGSITPGSGEYVEGSRAPVDSSYSSGWTEEDLPRTGVSVGRHPQSGRWFGRLFRSHDHDQAGFATHNFDTHSSGPPAKQPLSHTSLPAINTADSPTTHDGLWVTLAPTTMSSSPFFDTLLVLVVSPLVILTVVYALLLLRSRIRRRRWRAPKSVVERLPVRTYQTMPSTTTNSSANSAISPPISAATPLLPPNPVPSSRSISTRPRPRSRTVAGLILVGSSSPSLEQLEEKRAAGLAEWRRRYGGKQRECVVCLEEYVDGVSRVMSLPCGHEFHAECITPWLTTCRRTCPICKGDVVRSLARSGGSTSGGSANSPYFPSAQSTHPATTTEDYDDDDEWRNLSTAVNGGGEQEFAELILVAADEEEGDVDGRGHDERNLLGSLSRSADGTFEGVMVPAGVERRHGRETARRDLESGGWDRTR